jgi:hypothetical protein
VCVCVYEPSSRLINEDTPILVRTQNLIAGLFSGIRYGRLLCVHYTPNSGIYSGMHDYYW